MIVDNNYFYIKKNNYYRLFYTYILLKIEYLSIFHKKFEAYYFSNNILRSLGNYIYRKY